MKLFCILMLFSFSLWGQVEVIQTFDKKVYTPRLKALTDLVVDVESDQLRDQLNEQKIFGQIKKLIFKFYWTAQPERLAVDIIGLPEGFKEVKEELKANVITLFENVIPLTLEKKFSSYTFNRKTNQIIEAKAKDNLANVESFNLHFDQAGNLLQVVTKRAIGEMITKYIYDRSSFSDGKLVLKAQETVIEEIGNKITIKKEITYQTVAGIGVPQAVSTTTTQSGRNGKLEQFDSVKFSNYLVNKGEALKFFLNESK